MSYQERLLKHLAIHKRTVLDIEEAGVFRHKGTDVPKAHILPVGKKWGNLLEPARGPVQEYLAANPQITLHRYFHHLNSSQAFAFNLFFPFFAGDEDAQDALLRAFGQEGRLAKWEPEAVPDALEGTNLDARWELSDGTVVLCEVKLSESEFGRARNDTAHLHKLASIYAPVLRQHLAPDLLEPGAFFAQYQVLRNIWHLVRTPSARLVFLLPRENDALWTPLGCTLDRLDVPLRRRISVVAVEDLLERLKTDAECPLALRAHVLRLQDKYVPCRTD